MANLKSYPSTVIYTNSATSSAAIMKAFDAYETGDSRTSWTGTLAAFVVGGFDFNSIPNFATIKNIYITINAELTLTNKYITCRAVKNATSSGGYEDLGDGSICFIENSDSRQTVTKSFPVAASSLSADLLKNDTLQVRFYASGGGYLNEIYVTIEYEVPLFQITVTANPTTGGTVTGGGTYENGTSVTLTATPNTGYKFKQWSDGNTSATRTVTVSGDATYTAEFEKVATSNTFRGTSRQTSFGGTVKQTVYKGTTKIS